MTLQITPFPSQQGGIQMVQQEDGNQRSPEAPVILLVDDNAIQAVTRQAVLKRFGYTAITALNPSQALEQIRRDEFPVHIDAIITDHIMPEMTGAQFVRELRKIHPHLPVMVISGLIEAEDEYAGLNVSFRLKPLPPEQLLANLRILLDDVTEGAA